MSALQRRGISCVFVGYADHQGSLGYLGYLPGRDKLIISQNCTFHENEFPFKEGAIAFNDETRTGTWAKGFIDPQVIRQQVVEEQERIMVVDENGEVESELEAVGDQRGLNRRSRTEAESDDEAESDASEESVSMDTSNDAEFDTAEHPENLNQTTSRDKRREPDPDLKRASRDLRAGSQNRSRPGEKRKPPARVQIDTWMRENVTLKYEQQNPKKGKSRDRYEKYKRATNMREARKLGAKYGDFAFDYARGYFEVEKAKGDASVFSNSTFAFMRTKLKAACMAIGIAGLFTAFAQDTGGSNLRHLHPCQTLHDSSIKIHGNLMANWANAYDQLHWCNWKAGYDRPYSTGDSDSCIWETTSTAYIDLLRPYSHYMDHTYSPFGGHYDSILQEATVIQSGIDDAYFLYVGGDETMMDSMQDVLTGIKTPWTIKEALKQPQKAQWIKATQDEIKQLYNMDTIEWVKREDLPKGTHLVTSKIAYRVKLDSNNNPVKFKARCVARGYSQTYGENYEDTFQPVARLESSRAFIAYATSLGYPIKQLDFEGAYLQGKASHEIYMEMPRDLKHMEIHTPPGCVAKLTGNLYGLKQAGYVWWDTLAKQLTELNFSPSDAEPCMWIYNSGGLKVWLILHVDDCLFFSNDMDKTLEILSRLNEKLKHDIKDGWADWHLGVKIDQTVDASGKLTSVRLSQKGYMEQICKANGIAVDKNIRFPKTPCSFSKLSKYDSDFTEYKDYVLSDEEWEKRSKFRSNVGAILFLARSTMPTLSFAIGVLGRFGTNSWEPHWKEMEHLIKYISGVKNTGMTYYHMAVVHSPIYGLSHWNEDCPNFIGYTDSDYAGCPDTSRSTSGGVIWWMGACVIWSANLQACVTLSVSEAELVALTRLCQDVIWFRNFMCEMAGAQSIKEPSRIVCDNSAALQLIENRTNHSRTKHINLRRNFAREQKQLGTVDPEWISTKENIADIFTKAMPAATLERHSLLVHGEYLQYTGETQAEFDSRISAFGNSKIIEEKLPAYVEAMYDCCRYVYSMHLSSRWTGHSRDTRMLDRLSYNMRCHGWAEVDCSNDVWGTIGRERRLDNDQSDGYTYPPGGFKR